jgi:hypothetical protein
MSGPLTAEAGMPEEIENQQIPARSQRALPALIMGVSIGWLMGLSVSETVASTVAALLALVGGIGASLITVSRKPDNPVLNLWPMALLGLGIALGATAGLYTRTQAWLASSDPEYAGATAGQGVLYAQHSERCQRLRVALDGTEEQLRTALKIEFPKSGEAFTGEAASGDLLQEFTRELCESL